VVDETTYQPDDEGGVKYLTTANENLEEMVREPAEGGQTSPGVLPDNPAKFRNIRWTSEDLPPDQIEHFTL
jgi:hypothetical protein